MMNKFVIKNQEKIVEFHNELKNKELIVYGCGIVGSKLLEQLVDSKQIKYIVDDNPEKIDKIIMCKKVCSVSILKEENPEEVIILIANVYHPDILKKLEEIGIFNCFSIYEFFEEQREDDMVDTNIQIIKECKDKIDLVVDLLEDNKSKDLYRKIIELRQNNSNDYMKVAESNQYFPSMILENLTENETFLDLGVYDGFTIQTFKKKVHNMFEKIIGFEADGESFEILKNIKSISDDTRIEIFPYATYHDNTFVNFSIEEAHSASKISVGGAKKLKQLN